ncbi:hypothetical protein ES703_40254 [subsurface metagenome]
MDVQISGYRACVEYIKGQAPFEPWYKEPTLVVWLSINTPSLPVSGFGVTLPLKEYESGELKALIEREGSLELEKIIVKHSKERATMEKLAKAKREAEDVARRVSVATGIELLTSDR